MELHRRRSGYIQGSAEGTGGAAEAAALGRAETRGWGCAWDRRVDVLCLCWADVCWVDQEGRES